MSLYLGTATGTDVANFFNHRGIDGINIHNKHSEVSLNFKDT